MSLSLISNADLARVAELATSAVPSGLSHGTVRDYCQGLDLFPSLLTYNQDIKDAQRFWALKTIIATVPVGSTLLEIGAGEPIVADILGRLGYRVVVVDPYEGAGNGPTQLEEFRHRYPNVEYIVDLFSADLDELASESIDCCYSISVIEHIPLHALDGVVAGIKRFTKPGGSTIHAVDYVAAGPGAQYHRDMFETFAGLLGYEADEIEASLSSAMADADTYYLSAEAHNRWRGATPYDHFPMRRVLSMQIVGWPRPRPPFGDLRKELLKADNLMKLRASYEQARVGPLVAAADAMRNNPVLPDSVQVRLFNGRVITVRLREEVGRTLFIHRAYEVELSLFLLDALLPGSVFLDVGAHHGYFCVVASDIVGKGGTVHAFEPVPDTAARLRENVSGLSNVHVHQLAVGDTVGSLLINDYGQDHSAFNSAFSARVLDGALPVRAQHRVSMTTLDAFCHDHSIFPDVIKVDVESMEMQVVAGMSEMLRTRRPQVILEVGDFSLTMEAGVPSTRDLISTMNRFGYEAWDIVAGSLCPHVPRDRYDYGVIAFAPR